MVRLVADIGGTHSRLALADGPRLVSGSLRRLGNADAESPQAMFAAYLAEMRAAPDAACIAAAGPVKDGTVQLTNYRWRIDSRDTGTSISPSRTLILNDLQAMGHALAVPAMAGSPLAETRLVLALGTGNNAAVAHPVGGRIFVPPGEHGYIALPFTRSSDAAHLAAIAADFGAPVAEAALSGPGLARTHRIVTGESRPPEEIAAHDGPGRALALRLLGRVLASLALAHLPRGGIYLAGSVGRALHPFLADPNFTESYLDSGSYNAILTSIALRCIDDDAAPLHGAAHALEQFLS